MNTFAILKTKRWFRIIFTLLKIFLVLYIVWNLLLVFLTWPNYWDDKTIDDADLIPVMKEAAAPAENVATYLPIKNDATSAEKIILDKKLTVINNQFYINNQVVEGFALEQFIIDSQPLVTKFEKAASQSLYQCPSSFGQYALTTTLCELGHFRSLAVLTAFHAEYYLSMNDTKRAVRLITSVLNVGHLVVEQETPAPLIEHLVGLAIIGIALNATEAHPELTATLQPIIKKYHISETANGKALQAEYLMNKDIILSGFGSTNTADKKIFDKGAYFMRRNETVNNLAEYERASIKIAVTPCAVVPDTTNETDLLEKYKDSSSILGFFRPNFSGRVFLATILTSLSSVRDKRCELNSQIDKIATK